MSNTIQVNQASVYVSTKTSSDMSVNQAGVQVASKTIPDVRFTGVGVYVATKLTKTLYCWARLTNYPAIQAVSTPITITHLPV